MAAQRSAICLPAAPAAMPQAIGMLDADMNLIIEDVAVTIVNPSKDAAAFLRS